MKRLNTWLTSHKAFAVFYSCWSENIFTLCCCSAIGPLKCPHFPSTLFIKEISHSRWPLSLLQNMIQIDHRVQQFGSPQTQAYVIVEQIVKMRQTTWFAVCFFPLEKPTNNLPSLHVSLSGVAHISLLWLPVSSCIWRRLWCAHWQFQLYVKKELRGSRLICICKYAFSN